MVRVKPNQLNYKMAQRRNASRIAYPGRNQAIPLLTLFSGTPNSINAPVKSKLKRSIATTTRISSFTGSYD